MSQPVRYDTPTGFQWRLPDGRMHRLDGPAHEHTGAAGTRSEWWQFGKQHRYEQPAVEARNRDGWRCDEWWIEGERHRLDGPAVEEIGAGYSRREWWLNGVNHRVGGPAVVNRKTNIFDMQEWWVEGKLHRTDGAAAIEVLPHKTSHEWFVEGEKHRDGGEPAVVIDVNTAEGVYGVGRTREWWWHGAHLATRETHEPDLSAAEWEAAVIAATPTCPHFL